MLSEVFPGIQCLKQYSGTAGIIQETLWMTVYTVLIYFQRTAEGTGTDREINNIKIDNRLTSAIVSVDIDGFSPNNDLFLDEVEFGLYVSPLTELSHGSFLSATAAERRLKLSKVRKEFLK